MVQSRKQAAGQSGALKPSAGMAAALLAAVVLVCSCVSPGSARTLNSVGGSGTLVSVSGVNVDAAGVKVDVPGVQVTTSGGTPSTPSGGSFRGSAPPAAGATTTGATPTGATTTTTTVKAPFTDVTVTVPKSQPQPQQQGAPQSQQPQQVHVQAPYTDVQVNKGGRRLQENSYPTTSVSAPTATVSDTQGATQVRNSYADVDVDKQDGSGCVSNVPGVGNICWGGRRLQNAYPTSDTQGETVVRTGYANVDVNKQDGSGCVSNVPGVGTICWGGGHRHRRSRSLLSDAAGSRPAQPYPTTTVNAPTTSVRDTKDQTVVRNNYANVDVDKQSGSGCVSNVPGVGTICWGQQGK